MSNPVFKIGEPVECESSYFDHVKPRWNCREDRGGSGKYIRGKILSIFRDAFYLNVRFDHGTEWQWPTSGNDRYSSSQWQRPGYLRRITDASGKYSIIRHSGKWRLVNKGSYTTLEKVNE